MTRRPARTLVALVALIALAALAGCAASGPAELPPAPADAPAHAAAAAPATPPAGAPATPAVRDTAPSPAALAVLAAIPEPVAAIGRGASREPAPAAPPAPAAAHEPATTPDTLAASRGAGGYLPASDPSVAPLDTAAVPVPAPTQPLGSRAVVTLPATPEPEPAPAPAPRAPVTAPSPAHAAAVADTCWRLQVGAPSESARGRVLRDAAQSLLVVPMTVTRESGRWKVRTRDCVSRAAAESLRDRAVASGFKGVFLVRVVGPH